MGRSTVLRVDKLAVDEAIHLAHEGKLNPKNAWDVRILDNLDNTVDAYMNENAAADAYTQFTKAASIVESGAKVWAHRVESTFLLTSRIQQKLMRSDWADKNETIDGTYVAKDTVPNAFQHAKSLLHCAMEDNQNRTKPLSPAIVSTNTEISLTSKTTSASLVSESNASGQSCKSSFFEIDPLFKATASKLSGIKRHGNSGFLLNNTHVGPCGNILLGVEQITKESKNCFQWPVDARGLESHFHLTRDASVEDVERSAFQGDSTIEQFNDLPSFDCVYMHPKDFPAYESVLETESHEEASRISTEIPNANRMSTSSVLNSISTFYDPDWIPIEPETKQSMPHKSVLEQVRKDTSLNIALSMNQHKSECEKKESNTRKRVRFEFEEASLSWIKCDCNDFYKEKKQQSEIPGPLSFVLTAGKDFLATDHKRKANESDTDAHIIDNVLDSNYALSVASEKGIVLPLQDTTMNMYLKSFDNVNYYLQPFCSNEVHWNWLSKRKNTSAAQSNLYGDVFGVHESQAQSTCLVQSDDDIAPYNDNFNDDMGSVEASLVLHNTCTQMTEMEIESKLDKEYSESLVPEPKSMLPVLKIHSITKPSVIDVSKLRNVMWKYIERRIRHLMQKASSESDKSVMANEPIAFSEIVYAMIRNKEIHQISHDGTLSPAFFYFALLFLANERGLRLDQCEKIDDILIFVQ